jgi:hypothetical protein
MQDTVLHSVDVAVRQVDLVSVHRELCLVKEILVHTQMATGQAELRCVGGMGARMFPTCEIAYWKAQKLRVKSWLIVELKLQSPMVFRETALLGCLSSNSESAVYYHFDLG